MKITKFTLLATMVFLTVFGNSQNNTYDIDDNVKIAIPETLLPYKDQILKRLKIQMSWQKMEDDYFDVQNEDIIAGGVILYDAMIKNGLKPVDNNTFNEKIKTFFGINLNDSETCFLLQNKNFSTYIMPFSTHEAKESRITGVLDFERQNIYFYNSNNIFSYGSPLLTSFLKAKENGMVEFKVWEGDCYQNKFILNNDSQSLDWLLENNFNFLETLVREFGYDKNEKINKTLLNIVYTDYNDQSDRDKSLFVNLFVKKNCKNELEIRTELIKYITQNTTLEDNKLLEMLESYAMGLIEEPDDYNHSIQEGFNLSERIKAFTVLGYEIEKVYRKFDISAGIQNWSSTSCFYNAFVGNSELYNQIVKNNYYNIEGLQETVKSILSKIESSEENNSR